MLERLAAWFLNTYVADYVGNVVTNQLSIGLLKGAVELEKLPLKRDALKKLKLPVDVKSGYIGKLKLQIPVRYIKSQPWVVQIDQLYIIAGPPQTGDYDADEEERQADAKKQAKLDKLEQQWKAEQQKSSWWFQWLPSTSFPSNVIANLQVIVNDVHIRYEDSQADPGQPFTIGMTLENVSAQSTDENWEAKFVTGEEKAWKLVDLHNFAVYWDHDTLGEMEGQELVDAMLLKHASVASQQQPMMVSTIADVQPLPEFIIKPVSGKAKLTRNCSKVPLRITDGPRFHLDAQLEEIPIILSDRQYQALVKLFDAFNMRLRAQNYRKWRPSVTVKESCRAWWEFAINCVLHKIHERNDRHSKSFALERARRNVAYVLGYTQHLTQTSLSEEVRQKLRAIEAEQSFQELAVLRRVAMARVKKERDLVEAARQRIKSESSQSGQGILKRWFPGWMSGYQKQQSLQGEPVTGSSSGDIGAETQVPQSRSGGESESSISESDLELQEDELLNELGYEAQSDGLFFRDRILLTLTFSLGRGSFQLVNASHSQSSFLGPEPLIELGYTSLRCAADFRPKLRYASFDLSLGSLMMQDHLDNDSLFPVLVQPKGREVVHVGGREQLFQRQYTVVDPLDSFTGGALFSLKLTQEMKQQKHYHLRVNSKPLDIVYNASTLAQVKEFFTGPLTEQESVHQWRQELQSHTTAELRQRIGDILEGEAKTSGPRITVKLDISAPHIIIPEDFKDKETQMVILDLGHLTFGNVSNWSAEEKELGVEPQAEDMEEDDDDEFATPPSSPPTEEEDTPDGTPLSQPVPSQELSSAIQGVSKVSTLMAVQNDPFDRYLLRLSDLQVLVGKADAGWRAAVRSGHSGLHLLDKFSLSVRIQRTLHFSVATPEPHLSLAANLPSLSFHVDEEKVQALISCLQALHASDSSHPEYPSGVPHPKQPLPDDTASQATPLDFTASIYRSAYSPESFIAQSSSLTTGISMYHSFDTPLDETSDFVASNKRGSQPSLRKSLSGSFYKKLDPQQSRERHQRKMLIACEKLLSALLSIDEVHLSLSSKGNKIAELGVPGVKFSVLKRTYDMAVKLVVQDLYLVDRIQSFGPEYELIVCSSGKSMFAPSPIPDWPDFTAKSPPSPHSPKQQTLSHADKAVPGATSPTAATAAQSPVGEGNETESTLNASDSADIFVTSLREDSNTLLALTYLMIGPYSPLHPAMRDLDHDEGVILEDEGSIQRINLQCTAIDAIANQETIAELINFFQRAVPDHFFAGRGGDDSKPTASWDLQQKGLKRLVQTEVKINLERLGIRMLRRVQQRRKSSRMSEREQMSQLIASFMFYGVAIEGRISTDMSINGRLEGVRITDLTSAGKKYPEIVSMGKSDSEDSLFLKVPAKTGDSEVAFTNQPDSQCLSFSIHRSPRVCPTLSQKESYDIHVTAFVPSIHYTHSVNFVYEMEGFVSEFQFYAGVVTNSFKSAAVGVAKGLVREKSQLAEGLGRLSTSFGPTNNRASFSYGQTVDGKMEEELEETDGLPFLLEDRLYLDVSVQTPVIVVPSSLRSDDCLVAHLGEISIKNEFVQPGDVSVAEAAVPSSPTVTPLEVDRMILKITNVSLHASHDLKSREQLISKQGEEDSLDSEKCFKVLKETSLKVQIDRSLVSCGNSSISSSRDDLNVEDSLGNSSDSTGADVVITGEICEPLLIRLPKDVFDQVKTTIKHGLRKNVPQKARTSLASFRKSPPPVREEDRRTSGGSLGLGSSHSSSFSRSHSRTVKFNPELHTHADDGGRESGDSLPKIFASFTVPKLSLELKHLIDGKDRNLVYISFEEFSAQCNKSDPYLASVNLALKSIIIEDLLQPEHSEYRYLLASSSKPLPFVSPVSSPHRGLGNLSKSGSFAKHLLPMTKLMSTPKLQCQSSYSPLRSFTPYKNERSKLAQQATASGEQKKPQGDEKATDQEQSSELSDVGDMLSIKAQFVHTECPDYATTYNSISGHASVDFSSVYVIVNLQTWVLLFDYLGIGIPTPPPSRPDTPTNEDLEFETPLEGLFRFASPPPRSEEPHTQFLDTLPSDTSVNVESSLYYTMRNVSNIDKSLQEDALDFCSLGSDESNVRGQAAQPQENIKTGVNLSEDPTLTPQESLGSHISADTSVQTPDYELKSSVWGVEGKMSWDVTLNVRSLTVTFNKPDHPLARGTVSSLNARVSREMGNLTVNGSLGQASVVDLTETGAYYRERFTTTGDQALSFEVFKYSRPDPLMERPFDFSAKVQMASVRYLHTMRFLKEILAFVSHFPQLIDAFQRMKAMAQGLLSQVYHGPERKTRISLEIDIENPMLLIPKHAFSPDLMCGDLGRVRVTNATRYDGEEGTLTFMRKKAGAEASLGISSLKSAGVRRQVKLSPQSSVQSRLSTITVDESVTASVRSDGIPASSVRYRSSLASSMASTFRPSMPPFGLTPVLDSYSISESDNSIFGSFQNSIYSSVEEDRRRIERQLEAFKGPCLLDCIEVDLSDVDVFSARRVKLGGNDFKIVRQPGNVLKKKSAAKLYIERNLYEDFCRDVPDFRIEGTLAAIHVMLDKPQLELVKGLIEMNLGEGIEEFEKPSTVIRDPVAQPLVAEVWTGLLFRMEFVGVQLEFLDCRATETPGSLTCSLALFDIQQSEFSFESRSNQSKTADFTSHAVFGYDTRYQGYNDEEKASVFSEFLRPRFNPQQSAKKSIQVELHVTMTPHHMKASVLLNKLRLVGIFDLLLKLKRFIFDKDDQVPEEDEDEWEGDVLEEVDAPFLSVTTLRQRLAAKLGARPPQPIQEKKPEREVRLNLSMTETDFVVVEDMTSLDSNAVVLKGTLILNFHSRPRKDKTLQCTIEGLELFSCSLSNEDETALSILDPVSIGLEVKPPDSHGRNPSVSPKGTLIDALYTQTLEVTIQQLNFRLSYNDIKLFLTIAQSLPSLTPPDQREQPTPRTMEKDIDDALVKKLLPLGFTRSAIRNELRLSDGNLDVAALKLLEQQEEREREEEAGGLPEDCAGGGEEGEGEGKKKSFTIGSIEVMVDSLSVCLIDDCVSRDVPLFDFTLAQVQAEHDLLVEKKGRAAAVFSGEYYNRNISAWEPVIEPWRLQVAWEKVKQYSTDLDSNAKNDRMYLTLSSPEQLCVNVTSSLIHILRTTQASWRQDLQGGEQRGGQPDATEQARQFQTYQRSSSTGGRLSSDDSPGEQPRTVSSMERGLALLHSVRFISQTRQRSRFVPFVLRNSTGLPLRFATLTSVPSKVYVSPSALYQKTRGGGRMGGDVVGQLRTSEWMEVPPRGEKPFDFITRGKLRHTDTRTVIVHQLLVKVAGWQRIDIPVSVDKIGVFFREVRPSYNTDQDTFQELPSRREAVRLVFAILLSDTQKVVNVRSALILHNTLELPLNVRLEDPEFSYEQEGTGVGNSVLNLPPLPTRDYTAIPLHLTNWNIKVRPQGWGLQFCSKHLAWKHVAGKLPTSHVRACEAIGQAEEPPFRFCVSVQRENYPPEVTPSASPSHPAHTLTLHPPLTVANLLPCDIQLYLPYSRVRKIVRKGKEIALYSVDSMQPVEFQAFLEGFATCQVCTVSLQDVGVVQSMVLEDAQGKPLRLTVTLEALGGTAMKVSVSCSYWLINRTGLPLLFKQEGTTREAAGQSEEHERASTTTPLLFAYCEGDLLDKCTMRLGREYRYLRGGQPTWCSPFRMISDSGVIRVFVRNTDGRPDCEYQIGVDIHRGRRQYQNTRVVTFVARYQLENRTQYRLQYLQRHQLQDEVELSQAKKIPSIFPSAMIAFHWPRTDLDQLLNIRVEDISDCRWSGGFILDKDHSFHINLRGNLGHSIFIRCEVILKGATYHVIFSDAAHYPPPFRLENLSQMPVTYYQSGVAKSFLITPLNPGQSVPYAWDESTYQERLCLQVKGSQEVKEFDLNTFGPQGKLYYERYFYITAMATFVRESSSSIFHGTPGYHRGSSSTHSDLVLDVPQGTAVIFQKKDPERRSQLWRMTPAHQLVHVASSSSSIAGGNSMVLDIAGRLPAKNQFVPLVIRGASSSRGETQTWRFSDGGRLLLGNSQVLCVQSRLGYENLREGSDVVLGHVTKQDRGIPPSQQIRRMKHSPGSGVLSVEIKSDGPTRTLTITDENRKYTHTAPQDDWVVLDHGLMAPSKSSDVDNRHDNILDEEESDSIALEMHFSLVLEHGVGVSLINSVPEELLFATLSGIRVEFTSSPIHQCLNATIQHVQVDNQLGTSYPPILAYPTPSPSGEPVLNYPVLHMFAERVPHKSPFAIVFKMVEVKLQEVTLLLEEKLLFKLLQWAGVGGATQEGGGASQDLFMNMLTQRAVITSSSEGVARHLYFDRLNISSTELRVSMRTTSQLPQDLQRIKRHLGFPLVKFESPIYLDGFQQSHVLGTVGMYIDALVKHYKKIVKGQAISILGSVDFLGNPVGLLSDVASGVSGMIAVQPDVVGLVRDVAHGMSDTTSKLTGTVSHMLGQATFDSSFQEEREQMLESCQTSGDHLKAGLMGLSSGVFGGMTSLFTQPYKGAQEYGIGGFITGVGKGLLGTVAKPVAGLFDFASGTTAALRETTSRVSRQHPSPVRLRRCCVGPTGALTCYSISLARGQEYLLRLNDGNLQEKLISYELLQDSSTERMRVIISSQCLYFFQHSPPDPSSLEAQFSLDDLVECRAAKGKTTIPSTYIIVSLIKRQEGTEERTLVAPKFKCSDEKRARKIAQLINYAKNVHEEDKHIVRTHRLQQDTIW